ncbi:MAG: HdeD family acid-resistance protein [Anaerolineae bacterium]|nr:HdeD family acid-resistance protein [Anaerolineae bacterium]
MLDVMARNWWMLLIRGGVAVLFGIAVILFPGIALLTLVTLWGVYAVVDGIFALIAGIRGRETNKHWWMMVLEGIVSIAAGILTFVWPAITALILLAIIAGWAIITGILEIVAAIRLREEIKGEFWLGLSGLASVIFGVVLFLFPGTGILALLWVVGVYAIIFGVSIMLLSFRLKSHADKMAQPTGA